MKSPAKVFQLVFLKKHHRKNSYYALFVEWSYQQIEDLTALVIYTLRTGFGDFAI